MARKVVALSPQALSYAFLAYLAARSKRTPQARTSATVPPSAPESPATDITISHRINDIASPTPQNRLTTPYPRIVSQPIPQSIPPTLDFGRSPNRINNSRVRFVTLTLPGTPNILTNLGYQTT